MDDPSTRNEQITAIIKAVYPLTELHDLTITVSPGSVLVELPPEGTVKYVVSEGDVKYVVSEGDVEFPKKDLGEIIGTALGQALVAFTMINNDRRNKAYFWTVEKACRKAMDALLEKVASDGD